VKSERDEVARFNIVQAQVEICFIFNFEYTLPLYQERYHIDCQQSINAQHSLKNELSETQWPHTQHISLNHEK
jgi:hypothetical protein